MVTFRCIAAMSTTFSILRFPAATAGPGMGVLAIGLVLIAWAAVGAQAQPFAPAVTYPTGYAPMGLAVGDFNGDGRPDVAVVNQSSYTFSVYVNTGSGALAKVAASPSTGALPNRVISGDFNGDGKLDVAVANAGSRTVGIYLGNGDGTFRNPITLGLGFTPGGLAVADFNRDGKLDLAVTNSTTGRAVSVFMGNGDGSFSVGTIYVTGVNVYDVAATDLNGDGKPDLIVANYGDSTVSSMLNNGDGTFAPSVSFASGFRPTLLAVADLNGDGKMDLVVQNGVGFSIHLGRGDGGFLAATTTSVGFNPSGLAVGDFNGDGILDFAIDNLFASSVAVLFGRGDGTFQPFQTIATGRLPDVVAAGRLRGNGASDLVTTARNDNTLSVLLNTVVTAPPATLSVHAGSPQDTTIGSAFATPLSVDARDASGRPVPGAIVSFSAPGSGASGSFAGGTPTTIATSDLAGVAAAPILTANLTPGAYTVTATSGPLSTAFALTNVNGSVAPIFTSNAPPGGQLQSPYSFSVRASGVPPPGYAVSSGALPPGLSLTSTSGLLIGTPTSAGTFDGAITASNGVNPAATQAFSITIGPAAQSISFGALSNRSNGSPPFTVSAIATSGLPVSFSVTTGGYCSVSGTTVTLYAIGTCTVRASQAGNATYAAAANVDQSFQITAALQSQSILFNLQSTTSLGSSVPLNAVTTSGLPVSYSSLTTTVCVVSGASVQASAPGTCTIRASQPGNATYGAAPAVDRSMVVTSPLAQSITFVALGDKLLGSAPFVVSATASSALAVTFSSVTAVVCTVSGTTVTLVAAGTCTIRASQSGNATYAAAPDVDRSFQVVTATVQNISFAALSDQPFRAPPFTISASASSGLPVILATLTPAVCAWSSTTVTVIAVGTCTLRASQAGNASFLAAPSVERSFNVVRAAQVINFLPITLRALGNPPFEMLATSSSGLAVAFASLTPWTCRVNDQWLSFTTVGLCTVRAMQPGNGNFLAAASVEQSFAIIAANQTLLFPQPSTQSTLYPFTPSATASSGLPVTFSSLTPAVCTCNGTTVTLVAAGTCTIRATQAGNANYTAVSADRSFQVQANAGIARSETGPGPMIAYSTLLGGFGSSASASSTVFDIGVMPDGAAVVGGSVAGSYFPGLDAATFTNGGLDLLFLARIEPDRGAVDIATVVGSRAPDMTGTGSQSYIGAFDTDMAEAMAVDGAGTTYVAAYVNGRNYPLTGGTYLRAGQKAIFRVDGAGIVTQLPALIDPAVRSIRALALDAQGGIYFTGVALAGLSTTVGAAIPASSAPAGGPYLIKLTPGGTSVAYATYLSVAGSRTSIAPSAGQASIDSLTTGYALAIDASGSAYVAGQAKAGDFPVTPGSPDTQDNQNRDAFIAKVNPAGSALTWVARLGGSDAERATSIALAPDGGVVIGGKTASKPFLGTNNAFQYVVPFQTADLLCFCTETGYVAKLAADGTRWIFIAALGTFGGNLVRNFSDTAGAPVKIAVDAVGAIYASGYTSVDRQLPIGSRPSLGNLTAIQSPGFYDDGTAVASYGSSAALRGIGGFLMKMSDDGRELFYSVIVNSGPVVALKVDAFGAAYIAGVKAGRPQIAAAQAAPGAVFVTKVLSQPAPIVLATSPSPSIAGATVLLTATLADARYSGNVEFRDGGQLVGTAPVVNGSASLSLTPSAGVHRFIATFLGGGPFNGAQSVDVVHAVSQVGTSP